MRLAIRAAQKRTAAFKAAPKEPQLRLFVGFRLAPAVEARLSRQLQAWQAAGVASGRLTRADKLHVTLRFIGATPHSAVRPLLRELQAAMASRRPVDVSVRSLGSFRSFGRKFLIWAGVGCASDALQGLAAAATQAVEQCGLGQADDKPFRPHVTVARAAASRWCDGLAGEQLDFGSMTVQSVELFESRGQDYVSLGAAPLLPLDTEEDAEAGERRSKRARLADEAESALPVAAGAVTGES